MAPLLGIATCHDFPQLCPDDRHLLDALKVARLDARLLPWDAPMRDWAPVDAVLLRTTWDYTARLPDFLSRAEAWEAEGKAVWNSAATVRWNSDKRYLLDLEKRGVPVVPTRHLPRDSHDLASLLDAEKWDEAVVKPTVGAGGRRTFRVRRSGASDADSEVRELLASTDTIVQPFMPEIAGEGEWSFVFFEGRFSHALVKRPRAGEFRIQQLYGGTVQTVRPTEDQIRQAEDVLAALDETPLYARVDGVMRDEALILMELEVIEPELFFRTAKGSTERFVEAIVARMGQVKR